MYVKATNGIVDQFPYTVANLRRDNLNTSFPKKVPTEMLARWNVYPVTTASKPSHDRKTQNITRANNPTLTDGAWVLGWSVTDKTAEEVTAYSDSMADQNRSQRNKLLGDTDFYALSDVTMSAEMTTYRQALRDITSHANWPHLEEADWPTKPS
jgi:hypothetical protein